MITTLKKLSHRKIRLLFLLLLFQGTNLFAQHAIDIQIIDSSISCQLDSGYYSTDLRIGFNRKYVKMSIFSKGSNKLVEEFYMISDTSVCFVRYDANMNIIGIGEFMTDRNKPITRPMIIPDVANDPKGEKGLTMDWVCQGCIWPLKKEGLWIENSSIGYYSGGLRTGSWEFGKSVIQINQYEPMSISTDSISVYRDGKIEKTTRVFSHFNDGSRKLAGKWYFEQNRTDSSLYMSRHPLNSLVLSFVDFYSSYSYQVHYFPEIDNHIGQWEVNGDILKVSKPGKITRYKLEDLSESAVILRKMD